MFKNNLRLILCALAIFSAVFISPYVTLALIVALSFFFRAWEVPVIGLLVDFMWMPASGYFIPLCTVVAIVLVWIFEPVRNQFLND